MTASQAEQAMEAAVQSGKVDPADAHICNWTEAANSMAKSLGLSGTYTYVEDAGKADAVIYSVDTNADGNYDGYHDHFVNDIGNGKYYDPWTGGTGNVSDLHLTSKWTSDDKIKSSYRYLDYSD
jgi:hypothetical protein